MNRLETTRRVVSAFAAVFAIAGASILAGCDGESAPLPGAKSEESPASGAPAAGGLSEEAAIGAPPSSAPMSGPMASGGSAAVESGAEIPLKLTGIGSKDELDRALSQVEDGEIRALFERGFRQSFSHDRAQRDYAAAVPAMDQVLAKAPNFAPAYRVLAYAHFNLSFDMPKATGYYEKAVELDPNYGEAHYALAFMLTQSDMARARMHFDKSMALGVPDERDLKTQFFQ